MTKKTNDFDIVIVGAGLVGTSVIVGLQEAGFRIAVLEKHLPVVVTPNVEDSRPLSLAYGGQRCLDAWGVWSSLAEAAMPIQTLHVSEQGRLGRAQFSAKAFDLPALGYVIPFSLLQQQLYQCAAQQPDVTFIAIEKINAIVCDDAGAQIDYVAADKKHHISASLLIAADGAHSTCRDLLQIPVEKNQTEDVAFIATLQCEQPHQALAYQRFTQQGSLALLPLFHLNQYRLVWAMKKSLYEQVKGWSDDTLLTAIADAYGGRLGALLRIQREAVFPLETIIAKEMIRASAVLLGNAAHTIYPVAAQGFNLSLQDVAALTRVLKRAKQHNELIGALTTLERYKNQRQKNQANVIQWTRCVADVFRWRIPGFDHVRGMALLGLDIFPFVKENFAGNFLHV